MKHLLVVVALAACGGGTTTDHLAVGWRGPLPTERGTCPAPRDMAMAVQRTPDGDYLAVQPGVTELACARGTVRLDVRAPTQLVVAPLASVRRGTTVILAASVADAKGPLALGQASIGWTIPPGLREGERCPGGTCLNGANQRVIAEAAGTFTVSAAFGALTARQTIVVTD